MFAWLKLSKFQKLGALKSYNEQRLTSTDINLNKIFNLKLMVIEGTILTKKNE